MGMYPEVLLGMGFKLVRDGAREETDFSKFYKHEEDQPRKESSQEKPQQRSRQPAPPRAQSRDPASNLLPPSASGPQPTKKEEGVVGISFEHPDETLRELQEEFKRLERKAVDQIFGSMYSEVYHSLGFQFPGRKVARKKPVIPKNRTKRHSNKPPPHPETTSSQPRIPLKPIIDIGVLAAEVDAGRYPSINRMPEDQEYEDYCVVCQDGGNLLCCDFCSTVEHLKCIRTKFMVKRPEPEDDFMCHKCIGLVLTKRNRAEKRRLQKLAKDGSSDHVQNPAVEDQKYHMMAVKGRETSELLELLKDSQLRLRQSCDTVKFSDIRMGMIAGDDV